MVNFEFCPNCGKKDFKSKSGRTLHVKKCKGVKSTDPSLPCPKCGKDFFQSNSGRTLHIKACKGSKEEKHEYVCHCGQVFTKRFALTNHAKACTYEAGTLKDTKLKLSIRGKVSCSCPGPLHDSMKCVPTLGVNNGPNGTNEGCWVEGWGPCVYASGISTDKKTPLPCKAVARHRSVGGKKKSYVAIDDDDE